MRRTLYPATILLAIAWGLFWSLAASAAVTKDMRTEKRVALVIGNAAYADAPLRNPVNDAQAMAGSLRRLGFEVIEATDVNRRGMLKAIRRFDDALTEDAVGLFYYAGHGIQVGGLNYMLPLKAFIETEADVRDEGVDVYSVLQRMELSGSRLNLVILDACRNNPFTRSFRSATRGLAQMDAPSGSLVAYATAPGKVAYDGDGRNGLYTSALMQAMDDPGVPLEQMFKNVRRIVSQRSNGKQTPWESSSLTGDFFFALPHEQPKQVAALPAPAQPPKPDNTMELTFWNAIQNSQSPDDYDAYLQAYPNGAFAPLAQARSRSLRAKQEQQAQQQRSAAEATAATTQAAQAELQQLADLRRQQEEQLAKLREEQRKVQEERQRQLAQQQQLAALPPAAASGPDWLRTVQTAQDGTRISNRPLEKLLARTFEKKKYIHKHVGGTTQGLQFGIAEFVNVRKTAQDGPDTKLEVHFRAQAYKTGGGWIKHGRALVTIRPNGSDAAVRTWEALPCEGNCQTGGT